MQKLSPGFLSQMETWIKYSQAKNKTTKDFVELNRQFPIRIFRCLLSSQLVNILPDFLFSPITTSITRSYLCMYININTYFRSYIKNWGRWMIYFYTLFLYFYSGAEFYHKVIKLSVCHVYIIKFFSF